MSLKQKAVSGIVWSFVDSSGSYLVHFVIGIILARLLSPAEFGLVGLVTVFLAISQELIDSGFTQALIKKKEVSETEYSTVFFSNIIIGIICGVVLYVFSGAISEFYDQSSLKDIARLLSLSIVLSSFGIVETAKLKRLIDFKTQTKVSLISSILSGIVGVIMAINGFGVWSLVWRTVSQSFLRILLLQVFSRWIPKLRFSMKSLRELFSFGSKVLAVGLLNAVYKNILYVVIGKWFEPVQLGYYTRAQQFSDLPSKNLTTIIQKVSYPVLAKIPDDGVRLTKAYRQLITKTFFISCVIMMTMYGASSEIIRILIGDKWIPAIPYLKWTCLISVFYPISAINYNVFLVLNKPSLSLIFELVKKAMVIPVIACGVIWGLESLMIGMLLHSALSYFLISFYSGKMIAYPTLIQLQDLAKTIVLSVLLLLGMALLDRFTDIGLIVMLSVKMVFSLITIHLASKILKIAEYSELLILVRQQVDAVLKVKQGAKC